DDSRQRDVGVRHQTACSHRPQAHRSDHDERKSASPGYPADVLGERVTFCPNRFNGHPGVRSMTHTISTRRYAPKAETQQPERDVVASRLAYLTVGIPTAGTVAAVAYAVCNGLWLSDVVLFAAMYLITGLGVE